MKLFLLFSGSVLGCLTLPAAAQPGSPAPLVAHANAHPAGDAAFSFDKSAWPGNAKTLPIGMFDSGIGGLTVLEAVLKLDAFHNDTFQPGADGQPDFAQERFIYFGDQANMPYGNYPAADRTPYLRELILKDAIFLLGKRFHLRAGEAPILTKPPVKAIVIACNTATAYGLQDIREAVAAWGIPVIVVGVVEAGARGVLETKTGEDGAIGVLATVGTCSSGAYPKAIASTLGRAGRRVPDMVQQGSVELAGVIEGNPAFSDTVAATAMRDVRSLLETHLKSGSTQPVRTVLLGCTHFPLVQQEIESAFETLQQDPRYQKMTAAPRSYIDPAEWTARELFRELAQARLRLKAGESCVMPADRFFLSIPNPDSPGLKLSPDGGLEYGYKYGRSPGEFSHEDTINIPLTADTLPKASAALVKEKLPLVWEKLK
jgi:glutamate racemase